MNSTSLSMTSKRLSNEILASPKDRRAGSRTKRDPGRRNRIMIRQKK
ncbi:unnamed protein product [Notodromas monacha]|uniref:Uncharacterized protein n=1 Tax=Notodromas monacha TaxID=399045 RepID=A0A7R9C3Z0_9CRUS|nr:unnamed protein product [Notodromas monacha]CAG0925705.1 unnamed protein product [Notodromas monacha]